MVDVLQLCDIFENFSNMSRKACGLDPAWYCTLPGLSWYSMLKQTGMKLELFSEGQNDMIDFIEHDVRGGLSQISHRHAIANHKYLTDYDKDKNLYLLNFWTQIIYMGME